MSNAPETITIFFDEDEDGVWYELVQEGACEAEDVKYIRADLHQAAIVAAGLAERERCARLVWETDMLWPEDAKLLADQIRKGTKP